MIYLQLKWLDKQANQTTGVTWGVPWEQGKLNRNDAIRLQNQAGESIDIQTWPTAYWPDGSVKWTGHAAVIDQASEEDIFYDLEIDHEQNTDHEGIEIEESDRTIHVHTGTLSCVIYKQGSTMIDDLIVTGKKIGSNGKLVVIKEQQEQTQNTKVLRQEKWFGKITTAQIEQSGSIRSVIKIEGIHTDENNNEQFPFVFRLYFYRHTSEIRMVHTFIYDGDESIDFIKGIGVELKGYFKGEAWNRNIQVAGDQGMYSEPGQLLLTRRYRNADGLYDQQIAGETVHIDGELKKHVSDNATWNDFKISQLSSQHYHMQKRTKSGYSWIDAIYGKRASGLLYAGGTEGGLAVGIKDFWQKCPTSLAVQDLTHEESTIQLWLWSPDSEAMDFRHYSKDTHVLSAYEGFDEMRATPEGIANTSEMYVTCFSERPSSDHLYELALEWQDCPLLVCEPAYYYDTEALGTWDLPNNENPFMKRMEEQLDQAFQFYKNEIDQRQWYGYWNYGDVMHTYDPVRHQWRYDLGGFAWQNTELAPNLWLWYTFLRTGQADAFKMAEAMTRHTSEVDCYHLGVYKGLGSRHNVSHWGCGCKEVRISMAGLHKYYYFLTADERTGDLLSEVRDADHATATLDPMREFFPEGHYPAHIRVGPDWATFCSNWLSEWERTKNDVYRDKILKGISQLKKLPFRLLSGPAFGYDPHETQLYHMGDGISGGYHMIIAFGAPQVWIELAHLLDDPDWEDMIVEFGAFYALSDEEKREKSDHKLHDRLFNWPMFSAGLVAYAAHKKQDKDLAHHAWQLLLDPSQSHTPLPIKSKQVTSWKDINEIPWVTTNTISQWCLNVMMCMVFIGDMLPEDVKQ